MTADQALVVWAILAAAAPGQSLSDDVLMIRAELIGDLDFEPTRQAAIDLARSAKWVPSVAELREAVLGRDLPTPDDAWAEVRQLVSRHGWITPPCEHDCSPVAWQVIRSIGWRSICEGDEMVLRAHVLKVIAPAAIDRVRRDVLAGPRPATQIEAGPGRAIDLPDLRLGRALDE